MQNRCMKAEPQMPSDRDDYYRYIEYLQQQTLDEDWRPAFDSSKWKDWVAKNRERLEKMSEFTVGADGLSLVAHFERSVQGFIPTTAFELPTTKAIFEPICWTSPKQRQNSASVLFARSKSRPRRIPVHLRRAGLRPQIIFCLLVWAHPVSVTIGRSTSQP